VSKKNTTLQIKNDLIALKTRYCSVTAGTHFIKYGVRQIVQYTSFFSDLIFFPNFFLYSNLLFTIFLFVASAETLLCRFIICSLKLIAVSLLAFRRSVFLSFIKCIPGSFGSSRGFRFSFSFCFFLGA
jgi:hypothetical protein